jgi:hypothetical protein
MHRIAQTVQEYVRDHHRVDLSLHQADALVQDHLRTGRAILYCADGDVDLSGVIGQAVGQLMVDLRRFTKHHWKSGRQFHKLLFVGGGLQGLRRQFTQDYPAAHIPADPVVSNVCGLLKRAQRVFK